MDVWRDGTVVTSRGVQRIFNQALCEYLEFSLK